MCKECIKNEADIQRVKKNDQIFFFKLHGCYWEYFCAYFLSHTSLSEQEIKEEIYPLAFVNFVQNIKNGKTYDLLNKKQCTYLISIGKMMALKYWDKQGKERHLLTDDMTRYMGAVKNPVIIDYFDLDHRKLKIKKALEKLSEKCREIITLRDLKEWSIDAIQRHLKKPSPNSVRTQLSECRDKLREIFKKIN